jgi:signal peptidase I
VSDDAELRARIEAQMAARRAGWTGSDQDRPDGVDGEGSTPPAEIDNSRPAGDPRSVAPTRAWSRAEQPPGAMPRSGPARNPPRARGGVGPARPWESGADEEQKALAESASDAAAAAGPGLAPARPWDARTEAAPNAEPSSRTPSNPGVVLRSLAADPAQQAVDPPTRREAELRAAAAPPDAGRRRRALRWLLARAPETEPETRPLLSRLLGHRRVVAEKPDTALAGDRFSLPAPDAAFETPWLQSTPTPTRAWSTPATEPDVAVESEPGTGARPEATGESMPAGGPMPTGEPISAAGRPSPGPSTVATRRPSQGAAASTPKHRPSPGGIPVASLADAERRLRPAPGSGGGDTSHATAERSPAVSRRPSPYRAPDLSRFLEVTKPRSADDDEAGDEKGDQGHRGGGRRRLRTVLRLVIVGGIVAVAVVLLRAYVVQPYYIPSESMEPTLHGCTGCNDDHILVDKISYRAHAVHTRDIVVFHRPKNAATNEAILIKRVIATGGDLLRLKNGQVFVNGKLLPENYLNKGCGPRPTHPLTSRTRWKIPHDDVFVMGDNRCDSYDSRAFGPIPTSSIIGRAFAIIWPLQDVGSL